jgi:mono/diheme cytochrome c family protein
LSCANLLVVNRVTLAAGALALSVLGCSEPGEAPPRKETDTAASQTDLVASGRRVYLGNCTACHAMDPSQPGSLGPEVTGSSRALLEARIVHATYPDGYTPKRNTKLMIALPYLAPEIDALTAYLNP